MVIKKSFDFKNKGEITFPREILHAQDLYGILGSNSGNGIASGCAITIGATNRIDIASGTIYLNGTSVSFGGGNTTLDDAAMSSGQHRWVTIHITGAGAIGTTVGTAVSTAFLPVKPTDITNFVICSVLKTFGSNIVDADVMSSAVDFANSTVLTNSDVSDVGSGIIISDAERTALHPEVTTLTHTALTGKNSETDIKHLTDAQQSALHSIFVPSTAVIDHSDITNAGSGIIISSAERTALHPEVTALAASAITTGTFQNAAYTFQNAFNLTGIASTAGLGFLARHTTGGVITYRTFADTLSDLSISHGITSGDLPKLEGTPANLDYLRLSTTGMVGRNYTEVLGDIGAAPTANPTFTGEIGIGSVNVSETELGILEGATVTTAEVNTLDALQVHYHDYAIAGGTLDSYLTQGFKHITLPATNNNCLVIFMFRVPTGWSTVDFNIRYMCTDAGESAYSCTTDIAYMSSGAAYTTYEDNLVNDNLSLFQASTQNYALVQTLTGIGGSIPAGSTLSVHIQSDASNAGNLRIFDAWITEG